ncbi:transglycosylase SLT domain-containing protein [Methylobacterium sp. A54F]
MGVIPEPARCADDVSCLVPSETLDQDNTAARPPRAERRTRRTTATRHALAATLIAAGLLGTLPQGAVAPAALAHGRIDERAAAAQDLAGPSTVDKSADWRGVPLIEQQPATTELIASDLAALPQPARDAEDEAIRFGSRSVPRRIVDPILRASAEAGVDPAYMMALADKESSFETAVKSAHSSAEGLFQFVTGTWLEMIRDYGARHGLAEEAAAVTGRGGAISVEAGMRGRVLSLRRDPYVAALMAAELIKRDRARIEAKVGRALKTTELYIAHFLGTGSAGRFLELSSEKPAEVAQKAFRSAARANRSLFTQKSGKGRRSLTVAELHERLDDMIDRRLSQYQGVAALAGAEGMPREGEPVRAELARGETERVQVTEAILTEAPEAAGE